MVDTTRSIGIFNGASGHFILWLIRRRSFHPTSSHISRATDRSETSTFKPIAASFFSPNKMYVVRGRVACRIFFVALCAAAPCAGVELSLLHEYPVARHPNFSQQLASNDFEAPEIVFHQQGTGMWGGYAVFTISIFKNGRVSFNGQNRTRVYGAATSFVPPEKVALWKDGLRHGGIVDGNTRPFVSGPDSTYASITLIEPNARYTVSYQSPGNAPMFEVVKDMIKVINPYQKWVCHKPDQTFC